MSNYARNLINMLGRLHDRPIRPDEILHAHGTGLGTLHGCKQMAYLLFMAIRENHGDRIARAIFMRQAQPPTPGLLKKIANLSMFDDLEIMRPRSVRKLAKVTAEENQRLAPRERPPGWSGSTNKDLIERKLRALKSRHPEKLTPESELEEMRAELRQIAATFDEQEAPAVSDQQNGRGPKRHPKIASIKRGPSAANGKHRSRRLATDVAKIPRQT